MTKSFLTVFLFACWMLAVADVHAQTEAVEVGQSLGDDTAIIPLDTSILPDTTVQTTIAWNLDKPVNVLEPLENFRIDKIEIVGVRGTKPWIITRELLLSQGDLFNSKKWIASMQAIEKLDIFAEMDSRFAVHGDAVSIVFKVKEIPLIVVHPTGEYTEENGLAIGLGGLSTNLWGLNHYFQPSFKYGLASGGIRRSSLEYGFPRIGNSRIQTLLWGADERRENKLEGFTETYQVARVQALQTWMYRPDFRLQSRYEMWTEWLGADHDSILLSQPVCDCAGKRDYLPSLGFALVLDTRDAGGNPHCGWYAEVGAMYTGGILGGPTSFPTFLIDTRRHQPLSERTTFLLGQLWTWQGGDLGKSFPMYRRFWIGGANSVRGHVLGSRSGQNQAIYNGELQYLLVKPRAWPLGFRNLYIDIGLQPILGIDVATVWDTDLGEHPWDVGGYAGVQWLVPYIQMVRMEIGIRPEDNRWGLSWEAHLSPHSRSESQRWRRR